MNKKNNLIIFGIICLLLIILGVVFFLVNKTKIGNTNINKLKVLPKPEITGGTRGEFGIDKNINESTIDEYLNRDDSVYRDMRMLEDPGFFEKIGGDRFLSGYIDGFLVVPFPYIVPVTGLPSEVGDTYTGTTLFNDDNGTYVANYEESMDIIEELFPKDKVIFLMCGAGGYAGMTKSFLISLGWDADKIYNVGGYWNYNGKHSINIKKEEDGVASYDFDSVPYYNIEFDKLTKSANYKTPVIKVAEIKMNTSKIELEEGNSFKLKAIVLPNDAINKEVKWTSDNESIATVSGDGLVKAITPGTTVITATSVEENKIDTCVVTVNKKVLSNRIKIDDLSKVIEEFSSYDINKIQQDFLDTCYNSGDGRLKEEYSRIAKNGMRECNDLWHEENRKKEAKEKEAKEKRLEIFNKLIDDKKSFIVIVEDLDCGCESTYIVSRGAEEILKENNCQYLTVSTPNQYGNGDEAFYSSKLDKSDYKNGAIVIIKEGKIHATIDPDKDSTNSYEETRNWLSRYIDI